MRFLTYQYQGTEAVGVMDRNLDLVIPVSALGLPYESMTALISRAGPEEFARLQAASAAPPPEAIPYAAITKEAPIPEPRQDIICVGLNYLDHIREAGLRFEGIDPTKMPEYPVYFSKRVNRAVGDGGLIQNHFHLDEQLDYEVELAVVIGKDAKNVSIEEAEDYIFGYTIVNEVSARVLQGRHGQFYYGKSLDGFTPMGPWIVTPDELNFPLKLQSFVNGELRQSSSTDQLLWSAAYCVSELSAGITLKAGTIIATGTPAGVGFGLNPPRYLQTGDVVECVIAGIGTLRNTVS